MRICPHCETPTLEEVCPDDGYQTVEAALYMDPDQDPYVGTVFQGRYRIDSRIDIGGMSTVYRATQIAVGRPVALKIMNRELAADLKSVARFQQEARAIAGLRHPNTIRLFDYGQTEDGHLFLVMELLVGRSLAEVIDTEAPLDADRTIHIAKQIFDALAEAHANGIVHRDLKPDNIFLTEVGLQTDFVKILDFGIAKVTRQAGKQELTGSGLILGSPGYMAPEQVQGTASTEQTDIYAVGALMYEMLCGHQPFQGDTPIELAVRHVQDEVPLPSLDGAPLQGPLVDFILRCLEKLPSRRPPGAEGALRELLDLEAAPLLDGWQLAVANRPRGGDDSLMASPALTPGVGFEAARPGRRTIERMQLAETVDAPRVPSHLQRGPSDLGVEAAGEDEFDDILPPLHRGGSHRAWLALLAALVLLAAGASAWAVRSASRAPRAVVRQGQGEPLSRIRGPNTAPVPIPAPIPPKPAAPPPTAAKPAAAVPHAPPSAVRDEPKPPKAAAVAAVAAVAAPEEVFIELRSRPGGAKVVRDGKVIGKTPLRVSWAKGTSPPSLVLRRYHYETARVRVRPWQLGRRVTVQLEYDDTF